jgi:hypothetical protein
MKVYRFDFFFSYWILAWYLIHIIGLVKQSPKLALLIALISNICFFLISLATTKVLHGLVNYVIVITLIKAIPLATVWNEKIRLVEDLKFIALLYSAYLFYIIILLKENPITIYNNMYLAVEDGNDNPSFNPGMTLMNDLFH